MDTGGAGDQGLMFGFACRETDELMPLPIMLAHKLVRGLSELRRSGGVDYLRPDGKSQVTVEYDGDAPVRIDAIVLSTPAQPRRHAGHHPPRSLERIVSKVIPAT